LSPITSSWCSLSWYRADITIIFFASEIQTNIYCARFVLRTSVMSAKRKPAVSTAILLNVPASHKAPAAATMAAAGCPAIPIKRPVVGSPFAFSQACPEPVWTKAIFLPPFCRQQCKLHSVHCSSIAPVPIRWTPAAPAMPATAAMQVSTSCTRCAKRL
jgi:hypothetical protein